MSGTVGMKQLVPFRGGTIAPHDRSAPPIQVRETPLIIGRSEECHIVLRSNSVSQIHAEIVATEQGTRVRDLKSTNGVIVNGIRCYDVCIVGPATIQIGDALLVFTPTQIQVEVGTALVFGELVGASRPMQRMFGHLARLASTDLTVLVGGETGTGKELVARGLHDWGSRASKPFEVIDCSAIPTNLAESTLFGHERGAFTGAITSRKSPFVLAHGGTVFLDEIGELPYDVQPKLLRLLENRQVKALGSNTYVEVDVRIVAATRRDLQAEISARRFREDLYFRLLSGSVEVPPLRNRIDDLPLLLDTFARRLGRSADASRISPQAKERMMAYDWPGNVRQLKNFVQTLLTLGAQEYPTGMIEIGDHLSSRVAGAVPGQFSSARDTLESCERDYYRKLYRACGGNQTAMSDIACMSRANVQAKLQKYGVGSGQGQ